MTDTEHHRDIPMAHRWHAFCHSIEKSRFAIIRNEFCVRVVTQAATETEKHVEMGFLWRFEDGSHLIITDDRECVSN
jgi:hypothetical protein